MIQAKKINILIADDDRDLCESLNQRLRYEGFEALAAYEGVRVIEAAHRHQPDLILLDINMPAGTGMTVLRALRSREDTKKIPIIVMTAMEEPGLKERVLFEGANDFLKKPFEIQLLLNKIRTFLGGLGPIGKTDRETLTTDFTIYP